MSATPVKVLHLLGSMDLGGVETWLMNTWRTIDRTEFQFVFCHTKPSPGAYAAEIEALGGKMLACHLDKRAPIDFARHFRSILRGGQYDVVHSHVHHFSGFVLRLAHQESVPVRIAHCHSTSDGNRPSVTRFLYWKLMKRWILSHATHGLAASEPAADALYGRDWRNDRRIQILHCGVDLAPFRQKACCEDVRNELGIPLGAPVVGHVGRFTPAKNHAFLLRVAAEVIRVRPGVRFLLVGDGPLLPEMRALANRLKISQNVTFAGGRSDVPRLMLGAMNLFILPSLWEGLGLVIVEAQAAGLRCLISASVPREAIIIDDAVETVPSSGDARSWADHVLRLLNCDRIGQPLALRAVGESSFDIRSSTNRIAALYRQAI